ncbi:MAG TPA: TonB-dependent receptor [Acidobacteriaceae bacterium]|jgi:hypothetical protein
MRTWLSGILVFLIASSAAAFGQSATSSVRGVVTDSTGAAIPKATVEVANPTNGFHAATIANEHGEYLFQQLPPGNYAITVSATGFGQTRLRATLLVAQPATANAVLSVQSANTTIEVNSTANLLNATDATIGNAIDNNEIMQLPSEGRNPATLLALQPGVLYIGDGNVNDSRSGAVSGARADQTNITLDGLDNNDQIFPSAFTGALRISPDSTEEFRVTTSDANADTGRSSGGQVNLVTRSGTNKLHGAVYDYNRSSIGTANDLFVKQAEASSGEPNRPGNLKYNVYGIRLGGPLMRDKLFLFGAYEGDREGQPEAVTRTVPTASLRAGQLKYYDANQNIVTLTPANVTSMDPNCTANGTCPLGPGGNSAAIAVFQQYPLPNGIIAGDGLNTASYTFSSPIPETLGLYTSRLDFNPSDKHRFYVRGSFQNDKSASALYLPNQPPSSVSSDDSKGISGSYTWALSPYKINSLRYGFVRQSYATNGSGNGSYVTFRGLDLPTSSSRSSSTVVPLHNVIDDFTFIKGKHTWQFGANWRHYTFQNSTNANSFNSATANVSWLDSASIADTGGSLDPVAFGFPDVDPNFAQSYDYAVTTLAGLTDEQTNNYNYQLAADGKSATLLGPGVSVNRSFRSNEFEYYVQDTYKPVPNLTVTLGVRHTIQQTPWETNGQQVQPTINLHDWFNTRGAQAAIGNTVQPSISFAPAGQFRNGKPFYPMQWGNFAPRFALAFSPAPEEGSVLNKILGGAGHSSIRVGYGMYYDHFGQGLVANYSRRGSFSLSSQLSNPAAVLTPDTTPRFAGIHTLPGLIPPATSTITYPQMPSNDPNTTGFAITNGLDDVIQTPYSHVFNFSLQRQIKGGFTFEADYVGRLGRHLLQSRDLAQPLDLVDPKSGMDYYQAATLLAMAADQGAATVQPIAYWENMFPQAKSSTRTATQRIYSNEFRPERGNETQALVDLDLGCSLGCPSTGRYWDTQYSSLYVTSSMGVSSYNAGQFILRHPMSHDVQFDLSYTYSRSIDMGSDSESNAINTNNQYGFIIDAFNPRKSYALSDFDTTHLLTGDWVLNLPVGRGHHFAAGSGRLLDALIGGWNISGIARVSSGLSFGVYDGFGWGTNWEWESAMVQVAPIKMRRHLDTANAYAPTAFDDPNAALAAMREPYPGEAGERNKFRGDGYFDIDSGLHKMIHINDRAFFHLAWEVFNVTNSNSFDAHNVGNEYGAQNVGVYGGGYVKPRRMQLSGRFEF